MPVSNFYWSRKLIPSFSKIWFLISFQKAHHNRKASSQLKLMIIGLSQAKVINRDYLV